MHERVLHRTVDQIGDFPVPMNLLWSEEVMSVIPHA